MIILDLPTLESLPNPENITLIMPLRMGAYVEHIPFKEVIEWLGTRRL